MRIGISTSVIQRGKSGVGQYVLALLPALLAHTEQREKQNHELFIFALEQDLHLFEFAAGRTHLIPVDERFRPPVRNILWHQTRLPRQARQLRLDVLHIPSYRRMLWPKPCPLVSTIHDLAPFSLPGKYDWARMFYGRVVARQLARRQDRIIAVSRHTAADIHRHFGVSRDRVEVIWNGLDHERFSPGSVGGSRMEPARKRGLTKPFFLYVGRLEHPAKNHVRLISAFNRFKAETRLPWELVFAGQDWHGAQAIHAAAAQSPYARDIRFLGFVPDHDLADLYRAAEVFVYPSLYEGFGLPPIEAMACGCPVICSPAGALEEVAGGAAAMVNPEDANAIAQEMISLSGNPQERERLRRAGLDRAARFDWGRAADQTMKVFRLAAFRCRASDRKESLAPGPILPG